MDSGPNLPILDRSTNLVGLVVSSVEYNVRKADRCTRGNASGSSFVVDQALSLLRLAAATFNCSDMCH